MQKKKNDWSWNLDSSSDYLQHFGILGMHWGVRRYQNKDGSLTSQGRARLGYGSKKSHDNRRLKRRPTVKQITKTQKIGAIATAAAIVTAGGVYLGKNAYRFDRSTRNLIGGVIGYAAGLPIGVVFGQDAAMKMVSHNKPSKHRKKNRAHE